MIGLLFAGGALLLDDLHPGTLDPNDEIRMAVTFVFLLAANKLAK